MNFIMWGIYDSYISTDGWDKFYIKYRHKGDWHLSQSSDPKWQCNMSLLCRETDLKVKILTLEEVMKEVPNVFVDML